MIVVFYIAFNIIEMLFNHYYILTFFKTHVKMVIKRGIFMKKTAFTLAEVLITLGVIGVVAAITMPTLIQNYQKQTTVTQLKKAYSEISQALNLATKDYGTMDEWVVDEGKFSTSDGAKYFAEHYIFPNLKTVKTCIPTSDDCFADFKKLNGALYLPKSSSNYARSISFITASGYSALFWTHGNGHGGWYFVDINGPKKGPNIMGRDVFAFSLSCGNSGGKNGVVIGGASMSGNTNRELILSDASGCNKEGSGQYCAGLIAFDGWKIADDYPW